MTMEFGFEKQELDVLQTDVDDESGQVLGALLEKLLGEGALDAHLSPLTMKRGRPGVRVEVLCRPEDRGRFLRMLVRETGTLGVKARRVERYALRRETVEVEVRGRGVRAKVAMLEGEAMRAVPEFGDCEAVAREEGVPVRQVLEEARAILARDYPRRISGES